LRLPGALGPVIWRGLDRAVLWRLGFIEPAPPWPDGTLPAEEKQFWEESRVSDPPPLEVRRVGTRRRGVTVVSLGARAPERALGDLRGRAWLLPDASRRPFVLLLHGYAAPVPWYESHHARLLLRRGASAARIDLPYHIGRRIPGREPGWGFFGLDPRRTAATLRRATEDAAAVVAWARREVSDVVAVVGFSLGGLVACLLAAQLPLDSVVAVTPPCDLVHVYLERAPVGLRRRLGALGGGGGPWGRDEESAREFLRRFLAPVTPARLVPRTDGHRITLIGASCDEIVGVHPVRELATRWRTGFLELPGGHVTLLARRGTTGLLHDRLLAPIRAPGPGACGLKAAGEP
jgi:pimeloyl-ACP methyl ester carboxylesterase